jgi:hypothetical protein
MPMANQAYQHAYQHPPDILPTCASNMWGSLEPTLGAPSWKLEAPGSWKPSYPPEANEQPSLAIEGKKAGRFLTPSNADSTDLQTREPSDERAS